MPSTHNYSTYIFDCDGVILDSNKLKIDAMNRVLNNITEQSALVADCIDYFKNNFGKSRFHHVQIFVEHILLIPKKQREQFKNLILNDYSALCKELYLNSSLTPGFYEFINSLKGKKYVASGSEEKELQLVFKEKNLSTYFDGIFGSPSRKSDIVKSIIEKNNSKTYIMFGDSLSDLSAAIENNIQFIGYTPYSNVTSLLIKKCEENNFQTISNWSELNW
nr:HAD family hydrolase [Providencia rettgeri]